MVRVVTRRLPVVRARVSGGTHVIQRRISSGKKKNGSYLVGLVQRSRAVRAQAFKPSRVSIDAPVVTVNTKPASHHPIVLHRPGKSNARQEDVVNGRLNGVSSMV